MPFKSKAQERWAFSGTGQKALGGMSKVKEWANSTNQASLPEKVDPPAKKMLGQRSKKYGIAG